MTDVMGLTRRALSRRMATWVDDKTELVGLPWDLSDGEPVVIGVERLSEDLFNVTDRGLAAASLTSADVDLSKRGPVRSFQAVQCGIARAPMLSRSGGEFEIGASTDEAALGDVIVEVGEAVLRADALRVLGSSRRRPRFAGRIIRVASELNLAVQPQALMPLRFEGHQRPVSCRVSGELSSVFVQAVGASKGAAPSYDHARSVFADAAATVRRMTAVENGARLDGWQRDALREVSSLVDEPDLETALIELAA